MKYNPGKKAINVVNCEMMSIKQESVGGVCKGLLGTQALARRPEVCCWALASSGLFYI